MKLIIDRIENEYALCENEKKEIIKIHISKMPSNVKMGDIVNFENEKIIIDSVATEQRKKYIQEITKDIWQ